MPYCSAHKGVDARSAEPRALQALGSLRERCSPPPLACSHAQTLAISPCHGAPRRALGRRTSGAALQLGAPRGTLRAAGREAGGPLGVSVHLP